MKTIDTFRNKRVLVLGLAKSGLGAALLLHELGAAVTVNDKKNPKDNSEISGLRDKGIRLIFGSHPDWLLDEGFDWIVKNPGIPYTNPIIEEAEKRGIPILTEIELAYLVSEAEIIAVTGTNGKTTTTTLIYEFLKESGRDALVAGNIGTVASDVAKRARPDQIIVMETSSFQLLGTKSFKPKISVLTNLYSAHLDYHGSRDAYIAAKKKIVENADETDYFVYNANQPECREIARSTKAKGIPFSAEIPLEDGASVRDGALYFLGEKICDVRDIVLPGKHNLENILAALAAAKLRGATNEGILQVLKTFKGVKHRLQYIATIGGRIFYNDSKATNMLATQTALRAFRQPVVLLAGGLDRGDDFRELVPSLSGVKKMVVFGETKNKLREAAQLAGIETVISVDNVEEAVPIAYSISEPGDVILLSPACASWDQYESFEVRGDIFINAVHKLKMKA